MPAGANKILVVGPGAMGSLLSCLLSQAGSDVTLLDHDPARAEQLSDSCITLEDNGVTSLHKIPVISDCTAVGKIQMVFLCTKAFDTREAAEAIVPLCGPDTCIVSVQNGAGNAELIESVVGAGRIMACTTSHGATLVESGHVKHAGVGPTALAALHTDDHAVAIQAATLLTGAGMTTFAAKQIGEIIWRKLIINAAINPLTAIHGVRNGELLNDAGTRNELAQLANESSAIAIAAGADLDIEDPVELVESVCRTTEDNISSMLQDIRAGNLTEIDAINGYVIQKARALGLDAKQNTRLYSKVKELESGARA